MTRFAEILRALSSHQVDFVLVGGVAAVAHGASRTTQDVDIVYSRAPQNLTALVKAIAPLKPSLRGAPPGLPFYFDIATLKAGLNFTLTTTLGWLDLLGEITGVGNYDNLLPHAVSVDAFGIACQVLDLETLILSKRAAGRPKDFEAIAELESLRDRGPRAN